MSNDYIQCQTMILLYKLWMIEKGWEPIYMNWKTKKKYGNRSDLFNDV